MTFGPTHTLLRGLAGFAFASFWHKVVVYTKVPASDRDGSSRDADGEEEDQGDAEGLVPEEGKPVIVVANHHNSAADVAVLSLYFPHYRKLHYWAKSTLFAPGLPKKILLDAGNLPVDRKTKDNQKLFASSFDALKAGEAIVVFPEGGSDTVHEIPDLKDGASWAALEYAKNLRDPDAGRSYSSGQRMREEPQDVTICIAGISYSDKTKYRACAVMEFGPNISVVPYVDEFLVDPKAAVKKLTRRIREELIKVTVNAPDWDSRHAAMMARKILWPDDRKLPLRNLREIDQILVDLFATENPSAPLRRLRRLLTTYRDSLNALGVSHLSLSSLPLPETLDPLVPHRLPTRMRVFASVLLSTFACLIRLPFFLLPLVVHLPVYLFARYASSGALEEDQAQNKVAIGLVLALVTYATFFAVACGLLWTSIPWGGAILVAVAGTVAFVAYHNRLVDENYRRFQQLSALWTVLIALWIPVAQNEASQFLHSIHPALSPAPPPAVFADSLDGTDGAFGGDESDTAALLRDAVGSGGDYSPPPRKRMPLPSPTLFSEQDRLLGNIPHLGPVIKPRPQQQQKRSSGPTAGAAGPASPGASNRPRSRSLRSRSRASLDQTEHGEIMSSLAPAIEMPDLSSSATTTGNHTVSEHDGASGRNGNGDSADGAEWEDARAERRRARRSFAREVRSLLRLRATTVACLREMLFDGASGDDLDSMSGPGGGADGFGGEEERISTPTGLEDSHATFLSGVGAGGAHNGDGGAREVQVAVEHESRRKARRAGERIKELGWRGADLGTGKLL